MNLREYVGKEKPDVICEGCPGGMAGCPYEHVDVDQPSNCDAGTTDSICQACWDREYELEVNVDMVNHPPHYTQGKFEVIDVLEDWKLDFRLANAVKYISRCEHKSNKKQDLEKAIWYIQRYIDKECE